MIKDAYFNIYLLKIINIKKYKTNLFWIIKESDEQINILKNREKFQERKKKASIFVKEGKRLILLLSDNTQS